MRWPWSDRGPNEPEHGPVGHAGDSLGRARASGSGPDADSRPVWLLDVDGVLNASRPGWGGDVAEGWARADHGRFWIRWSPSVVRRMLEIERTGGVEVRWATTWVPWIQEIERLLGLPDWPVAWDGPYEGLGTPAIPTPLRKVQTALHVVEQEQRPLVWTDDDSIPVHGPEHERIMSAGVPSLLVRPASRAGLQPHDLDAIEEFVRRYG